MTEEPYAVSWTPSARKALTRLPEKVATAAIELLYGPVTENPHRVGKPLRLGLQALHSARRGDYRVLYSIDDPARTVVVVAIEHRADAYRRRD